jgi:hypothetical protein
MLAGRASILPAGADAICRRHTAQAGGALPRGFSWERYGALLRFRLL